jgi:hypothetical protein
MAYEGGYLTPEEIRLIRKGGTLNPPKAHQNIDNEIALETLNRIMHGSYGNYFKSLYEAETKGGDKRYITRSESMFPKKENLEWVDDMLRREIRQNPQFSDTLSVKDLSETKRRLRRMQEIRALDTSHIDRLSNFIKNLFNK